MKSKRVVKAQVQPVMRHYAELASIGYPGMEGIRLRYRDGSGQWITPDTFINFPEKVVKYLNDWITAQYA